MGSCFSRGQTESYTPIRATSLQENLVPIRSSRVFDVITPSDLSLYRTSCRRLSGSCNSENNSSKSRGSQDQLISNNHVHISTPISTSREQSRMYKCSYSAINKEASRSRKSQSCNSLSSLG